MRYGSPMVCYPLISIYSYFYALRYTFATACSLFLLLLALMRLFSVVWWRSFRNRTKKWYNIPYRTTQSDLNIPVSFIHPSLLLHRFSFCKLLLPFYFLWISTYLLRSLGSQFEENIFCSFYEYCGNNSVWELMYRHKVEENSLPYRDIKHYATMVARYAFALLLSFPLRQTTNHILGLWFIYTKIIPLTEISRSVFILFYFFRRN